MNTALLKSEISILTLRKYTDKKTAHRLQLKLNSSIATHTFNEEYVIYLQGRFVITIGAMSHWKLCDIWDRVEEMFSSSQWDNRINLKDWGLIARIVITELIENVRIANEK